MKDKRLLKLTYTALFTAIVFILTYLVKIPVPYGYIHLGDTGIYAASILLGPFGGAFAGGIGAALADIAGGYAYWALPTVIIKALMGIVVGLFCDRTRYINTKNILLMVLGSIIMVLGYYITLVFIFKEAGSIAALALMGFDLIQGAAGVIGAILLLTALQKANIFKNLR